MGWALFFVLALLATPIVVVFALYLRWWFAGGRGSDCDSEPLPLARTISALLQEAAAMVVVVAAMVRGARLDDAGAAAPTDIVLLAGSALGEAALGPLAVRLSTVTSNVRIFRPASWRGPLGDTAAELNRFLRGSAPGRGTVLIAYAATGLLLRYYLRRYSASGIRRVVTVATPHQGSDAPPFDIGAPLPPPETVKQIAAGDRIPHQFDVIAIYSDFDAFIAPTTHAYYPGAFNIQVRGMGHFTLLRSARLFELLRENLDAPPARRTVADQRS